MISRFFKRRRAATPAPADGLPASLEAAIEGLSVVHRGQFEGKERVMLAFAGETVSAWHHSPDETRRRLAAAWPELTEKQLDRALRGVVGAVRASGQDTCHPTRSAWMSWGPNPYAARED